ncbi:Membrane protein involved in the export of O-antigen and teichoic acid [Nocardioides exalbidus]|uniref:Membrane protein involved in the export of O-antigen and teichoic acid n=1 Tax=Nocardioides exalbidus TaxID=402596 RepID=A0A1H4XAZ0_9ACTN|nr:oligosaccharide flippase family protein [Nocardioides exalbidus]SED02048.1 Membrane protein involved in the export of O-antigen and teichoic acid [Nocardioides exalbidus]
MSVLASVRRFLGGGGGIVVGTAVMNACTFGFTIVAAGILGTADYGAFFALLNLLMVISVVNMGLQATAARRIVAEPASVGAIEHVILRVAYGTALAVGGALVVLSPAVVWLLQLDSLVPALVLAALAAPTTVMGAHVGILQGEKRWAELSWLYVLAGIPRIAGLVLLWVWPDESVALFGSGLGYVAPAFYGWWVLRRPRTDEDAAGSVAAPDGRSVLRESLNSAQALLAFFALANVDIVVARHVLSDHASGLYAVGLLVAKIMLYLPQFVVIVMFPSLATSHERRRAVVRGTTAIVGLGAACTLGVVLLAGVAADLLHSEKLAAVEDHLWLFAVLGTLLSITQLLVYATLARRGRRSIVLVWVALVVCVVAGSRTTGPTQLLAVMITVATVLTGALVVTSLRADVPADAGSVGGVVPAAPGAD